MQRIYSLWSALLAVTIVATSIYGGVHYFSPIPYWDQWNGYIGFYHAIQDGDYKFFWSQHMDHRIVLPRILFFLDIYLFGGWNAFCIVAIYAMLAGLGVVIWLEYKKWHTAQYSPLFIIGLIFSFLFSWIQNENLKWGFQSQFIAIYLFAMMAFAFYSKPTAQMSRIVLGVLFCGFAELSMGNGIATFFVMATQGVLLRRSWREIVTIIVAGVIASAIYLHHFVKPILPVDPAIAHVPLARLKFFLIFLGNPFYWISNSLKLAAAGGLLLFIFAALATAYLYKKNRFTPYRSFLVAGYGLVFASAIGATQGRWMLGLNGAVASRYTLPVLLSFLLLSLLAADMVTTKRARTLVMLIPVVFLSFLVKFQENVNGDIDVLYRWKLAVLAQKIGLDRPQLDSAIFPLNVHDVYVREANFAAEYEIGPYSRGWLHDAGIVKFDKSLVDASRCTGFLEATSADSAGIEAAGWVVPNVKSRDSLLIVLTNPAGETVGYGVSGKARPDVKASQKDAGNDAGWTGFAKPDQKNLDAYALIGDKFCPLQTIRK
ncbi:hypothetical protein PQQ75_02190 [Paraburkholderia aspalathi]|uniref:hypothetical protein n=1 Tax=Paraburkholderia aspalathi TaxID=1324617 RepID=UPI0038BA16CB